MIDTRGFKKNVTHSKMFFDDNKKTAKQKEVEFLGQFKGKIKTRKNAIAITYTE